MALDGDRMHASVVGQGGANSLERQATCQVRPSHNEPGVDHARTFDERGHLRVVTRVGRDRHPGDGREGNPGDPVVDGGDDDWRDDRLKPRDHVKYLSDMEQTPASDMRSRPLRRAQRRTIEMLKKYCEFLLRACTPGRPD